MNIFERYIKAKNELSVANDNLTAIQAELYTMFQQQLNEIDYGKTFSAEADGYSVKIIKKESVTVDQKLADVIRVGFKKRYSLDKTAYKKLSPEDQKRVDECLTTKPAKPTFTVEAIDD